MEFIAKEGALKIKEIGYLHTEGYSAVALKHGPFALLQSNTPVIFVNPDDENAIRVNSSIEEVKSRLAPIILISNKTSHLDHPYNIIVPANNTYSGIIHVLPLQLIAYYLSVYRGNNPDMPRNLAKAVTVF
jgi:glutamine---fructose-6-phosphate transaminase (isomerizing)